MPQETQENVPEEAPSRTGADVEMLEGEDAETGEAEEAKDSTDNTNGNELPFANDDAVEPRTTFASYLMTPIVTLLIGSSNQTILTAHQGLLTKSPYFEAKCKEFIEDGNVRFPTASQAFMRQTEFS